VELHPGEEIIYQGHPSWRATLAFYITGLLLAVGAGAIGYAINGWGIAAAVGGVFFVGVLIVGFLRRIGTRYVITSKRLQIRQGLIGRRTQETRIERLIDVTVRQSIPQRLLGVGNVDFDNASAQQGDLFTFWGIRRPDRVVRAVDKVHEMASTSPAGPPADGAH
jgi:uncharacterized membrane protein YdbT with pleckstrin-like domain